MGADVAVARARASRSSSRGGLAILLRLRLLGIALGFWVTFAAGLAVLAASGHAMTARWHLGPVEDWHFWRVLVFSPEILVFLFFMITDPKTIPAGRVGRRVYAVAIGALAVLLIAPQTTEFGTKVAVLGALALVCARRPARSSSSSPRRPLAGHRPSRLALAAAGGIGSRRARERSRARRDSRASGGRGGQPGGATEPVLVSVRETAGIAPLDRRTAEQIAQDVAAALRVESDALRRRDPDRAAAGADGARLASLWAEIRAASGASTTVPEYRVESVDVTLEPAEGQSPPTVVADVEGTVELVTYEGSPPAAVAREAPTAFSRTFELSEKDGRYLIARVRGGPAAAAAPVASTEDFGGVSLEDVAAEVGLDFRHGAFRFGMAREDTPAMMGGGLCWLDYDADGWLDLYVVNSYADVDFVRWEEDGGLPRSGLFHNVRGRFENVGAGSGADLPLRGSGCVAADFNGDGHTDLYVTDDGLQRRDRRLRRPSLGARRRDVHGGRARRRPRRARLALGRRGRGRQRRRPSRPVRRGLHRRERADSRAPQRVSPRTTGPCATCCTSTSARTRTAARASGRSAARRASSGRGSTTGSARSSRTSTTTAVSISTSRTTRTRTGST